MKCLGVDTIVVALCFSFGCSGNSAPGNEALSSSGANVSSESPSDGSTSDQHPSTDTTSGAGASTFSDATSSDDSVQTEGSEVSSNLESGNASSDTNDTTTHDLSTMDIPVEPDAEFGDCPEVDAVGGASELDHKVIYSGSTAFLDTTYPMAGIVADATTYVAFKDAVHAGAIVWPEVDFSVQRIVHAAVTVVSSCLVRVTEHHLFELDGTVVLDV